MIFNMTLLEWLMVLLFWHSGKSPFFRREITSDYVHSVGNIPVLKISLQTVVRQSTMAPPTDLINSAGMLSTSCLPPSSALYLLFPPFS